MKKANVNQTQNGWNETALTTVRGTSIEMFGETDEIMALTDRLMSLHTAATEVGKAGMRAVAQLAVLTGANPLPASGEIWVWQGKGGKTEVDLGIAYYRRIANTKDRINWIVEPRPMTESEREKYGIPDGYLASIAVGYPGSRLVELVEMGMPWELAEKRAARTAYAVVRPEEMYATRDYKNKNGFVYRKKGTLMPAPEGRTWQWTADKRAEKDFYKLVAMVDTTLAERIEKVNRMVNERIGGDDTPKMEFDESQFQEDMFGDAPATAPASPDPAPAVQPEEDDVEDGEFTETESEDDAGEDVPELKTGQPVMVRGEVEDLPATIVAVLPDDWIVVRLPKHGDLRIRRHRVYVQDENGGESR